MGTNTREEILEAWDNGQSLLLINMGGMGEDYDFGICRISIPMLRAMPAIAALEAEHTALVKSYDNLADSDDSVETGHALSAAEDCWKRLASEVDQLCDDAYREVCKQEKDLEGVTGAMFGAAKSMAWQIYRNGMTNAYQQFRETGDLDRLILVSKDGGILDSEERRQELLKELAEIVYAEES